MKFTEEQLSCIRYGSCDCENQDCGFELISDEIIDKDTEKGSVDIELVVLDSKTGKYYKGVIRDSPWYKQEEWNAEQEFDEVKPKIVKKTTYE